ncbi:hypothetical protein FQN57_004396 [Myotisia sp. PD_48]|nr:hypothetical protein FQN57_004396 [Myotisia sp. PD_48]
MDFTFRRPSQKPLKVAQLWQLTSLSAGERLEYENNLQQVTYTSVPEQLLWQLAVPDIPPLPECFTMATHGSRPSPRSQSPTPSFASYGGVLGIGTYGLPATPSTLGTNDASTSSAGPISHDPSGSSNAKGKGKAIANPNRNGSSNGDDNDYGNGNALGNGTSIFHEPSSSNSAKGKGKAIPIVNRNENENGTLDGTPRKTRSGTLNGHKNGSSSKTGGGPSSGHSKLWNSALNHKNGSSSKTWDSPFGHKHGSSSKTWDSPFGHKHGSLSKTWGSTFGHKNGSSSKTGDGTLYGNGHLLSKTDDRIPRDGPEHTTSVSSMRPYPQGNIIPTLGSDVNRFDELGLPRSDIACPSQKGSGIVSEVEALYLAEHKISNPQDETGKRKRDGSCNEGSPKRSKKLQTITSKCSVAEPGSTPILKLPEKLMDRIFEELNILSRIKLGLTSRHFLTICAKNLQNLSASNLGPWSGESVICVGSAVNRSDYPPNLFSDPQLANIFTPRSPNSGISLYTFSSRYCDCVPAMPELPVYSNCGFLSSKAFNDEFFNLPLPLLSEMINILCPTMEDFYTPDKRWILRNLTTKETVNLSGIAIKQHFISGPHAFYMGFGDVLMNRVCWSSYDAYDISTDPVKPRHRGAWAGHRFEITTVDMHKEAVEKELREARAASKIVKKWKDVTRAAQEEIVYSWVLEYGSKWKDAIANRY